VYCADSSGSRNASLGRVLMGAVRRRGADRAGWPRVRSPGRPSVGRREERQRFWRAIAAGCSSEEAAEAAGVSAAVGVRWFREGGGMRSVSLRPRSGRYLSFSEREEIALLRVGGVGVREIARRLGVRRRRSRVSCVGTPRPAAAGSSSARRRRGGTPTGGLVDRSRPGSRRTWRCGGTCGSGSRGWSPPRTASA
jgi:hypothetical protein